MRQRHVSSNAQAAPETAAQDAAAASASPRVAGGPSAPDAAPPSSSTRSSSASSSDASGTVSTSSASSASATDPLVATASPPAPSTGTRARHWLKEKLIPQAVSDYGKTVYGGAPLAQQTLPGYFNYPSPFLLVPFFFLFTIPFVVVGALVLVDGPRHRPVEQAYSQIHQYQYLPTNASVNVNDGLLSFNADGVTHRQGTRTWLQVHLRRRLDAPVYLYYKLENFHQNFRDFHDGRSNPQLTGKTKLGNTYTCKPYAQPGFRENELDTPITFTDKDGNTVTKTLAYFTYSPCGMAPWSMFNDTFVLYRQLSSAEAAAAAAAGTPVTYGGTNGTAPLSLICNGTDFGLRGEPLGGSVSANHCRKTGISWKADREIRYHNMTLRQDWWSLYYPYPTTNEYLRNGWYLHEPGHALPDQSDYDLQVWMRAAFTANFRKLYRIITTDLPAGTYWVDITELYDVVSFRGGKSVVLHKRHWSGGRNLVLGIVFIVMGCMSFIFGVAFTVECLLQRRGVNRYEHLREPKRSWYVYPPDDPQFAAYYQLRLRRHIPMSQLQALRKTVEELEGRAPNSHDNVLLGDGRSVSDAETPHDLGAATASQQ